ncbi:MAG TPA: tRNA pseudouridine(55) synthase TruB, partial [Oceanospirillaceae bacterium]|nr:tRNA pseudouridine(55) synthase TruB [Oceanospirillaceae bacterium]
MTRQPKGRLINGILILDKPTGMSSNHALQRV